MSRNTNLRPGLEGPYPAAGIPLYHLHGLFTIIRSFSVFSFRVLTSASREPTARTTTTHIRMLILKGVGLWIQAFFVDGEEEQDFVWITYISESDGLHIVTKLLGFKYELNIWCWQLTINRGATD